MNRSVIRLTAVLIGAIWPVLSWAQAFEVYSGEETYYRFCASCHGPEGRGDGRVAAGLKIIVPDLTLLRRHHGANRWRDQTQKMIDGRDDNVYHGSRIMPVWGYAFWFEEGADEAAEARVDQIMSNLLDYLESMQVQ